MNLAGLASSRGQLALYDDNYSNVGNPTGLFKDAKSIWLNEEDNAGTPHGFAGVEAGEMIELFVQGEPEFGLYEVVDVHDETNGAAQWWVIEVNFVRTLEDTSTADNGDLIRVKIFQAPTGGNAGDFVKRSGDTMTGALSIMDILGYDSALSTDRPSKISLGSSTNGFLQWNSSGRIAWNETGGYLAGGYGNSSASIIGWDRAEAGDGSRYDFAAYYGVITEPKHITNKEYVDDKMQELLDRIEELEMAGHENYRLQLVTRNPFSSGTPGQAMDANQIFS